MGDIIILFLVFWVIGKLLRACSAVSARAVSEMTSKPAEGWVNAIKEAGSRGVKL